MVYFVVSFAVLAISALMFQRAAGSLSLFKPNLISYVFYYNIFLQTFLGSVLAVLDLDNHYIIDTVGQEARFNGWLSVMYLMIAFPLGMWISKLMFTRHVSMRALLDHYSQIKMSTGHSTINYFKASLLFFTLISVFACIYTFWKLGYHPFWAVTNAPSSELAVLRGDASRNFSGNVYIRNFFALALMPVLSYAWAFYYLTTRRRSDLLLALVSLFFALSILYYNFSKGPILWHIVGFLFVYFYTRGELSLKFIAYVVGVAALAIVGFYLYSGNSLHTIFGKYYSGPIGRIILSQVSGLFVMFEVFPYQHDFIGFSSMSRLLSEIMNVDYTERAARIAMTHFNPSGVADGVAGVMSTIFIGEAWANFGIWGLLLSPLWVGFLIHALYVFFLTIPKNPLSLGLFVSFSLGGVTGGFNHYLYNPLWIMTGMWVVAVLLMALLFRSVKVLK